MWGAFCVLVIVEMCEKVCTVYMILREFFEGRDCIYFCYFCIFDFGEFDKYCWVNE